MRISDWSSDVCSSDLVIIRSQLPGSILYKPGETQDFFSVITSKSPAIPQSMKCLLFPEMGRLFIQHYRLGLKIGQQPLDTALAPDAGLFKSPEGDGKPSLEAVVAPRAGAEPPGRAIGALGIVGESSEGRSVGKEGVSAWRIWWTP